MGLPGLGVLGEAGDGLGNWPLTTSARVRFSRTDRQAGADGDPDQLEVFRRAGVLGRLGPEPADLGEWSVERTYH